MNYIIINDDRYNLTDEGIRFEENSVIFTIKNDHLEFDEICADFNNVGDSITIYGIEDETEFESGKLESYSILKAVNYDLEKDTYSVRLMVSNEVSERLEELESAVNYLIMGGE